MRRGPAPVSAPRADVERLEAAGWVSDRSGTWRHPWDDSAADADRGQIHWRAFPSGPPEDRPPGWTAIRIRRWNEPDDALGNRPDHVGHSPSLTEACTQAQFNRIP